MPETSHSFLERLKRQSDPESWERLVSTYTPLFHSWLRRYDVLASHDVIDLVQEVLLAVFQDLPKFNHNQQPGAFRAWLRTILVNRLRKFWSAQERNPTAVGGSDFLQQIGELEDSSSQISERFDREHDRHIMRRLLAMVKSQFTDQTWQIFHRVVLDGTPAGIAAGETGVSLNSVYTIKSRVLRALRQAAGWVVS